MSENPTNQAELRTFKLKRALKNSAAFLFVGIPLSESVNYIAFTNDPDPFGFITGSTGGFIGGFVGELISNEQRPRELAITLGHLAGQLIARFAGHLIQSQIGS